MVNFNVNLDFLILASVSFLHLFWKRFYEYKWHRYLQAKCISHHPINTVVRSFVITGRDLVCCRPQH